MVITKKSKRIVLASAAGFIALPATAFGQSAPDQTAPNTASSQITDIVVTARRVGESAQKVPVAITTLSNIQLERTATTNVTDLNKATPSLNAVASTSSPMGLEITMRAQVATDTAVSTAQSVGVYLDDVFNGASSIDGTILDMSDLNRVEVLKGPQGTLYGRNVTGGLIKFVTNEPTNKLEGYIKGGLGNYDRHYINGMLNIPIIDGKLAFRLVGTFDEHGGYSKNILNNTPLDDMHKWSFRGELKYTPSDNLEVLVQGWAAAGHDHGADNRTTYLEPGINSGSLNIMAADHVNGITAGSLAPLIFGSAGGFTPAQIGAAYATATAALPAVNALVQQQLNAPRDEAEQNPLFPQYDRAHTQGASATIKLDLGSATIKSITSWIYAYNDRKFNVGGDNFIPIYTGQTSGDHQYTEELQITGTAFNDKLKYAAGLYYIRSTFLDARNQSSEDGAFPLFLGQFGLGITSGSVASNTVLDDSTAGYGQFTYSLIDTVHFTGGLRYTDETTRINENASQLPNATNGEQTLCIGAYPDTATTPVGAACAQSGSVNYTNWSYTAGLDWQVVDRTLVYVKTSRGFKSGGLNAFASAYAPITGYAPEVDTDYEVGVKSELLDRRLRLDLDYYHTNYSNIQRTVATSTQVGIVTEVQNAATAKIDGVEAEARFIPAVGLTLSANGTYTNARYINYEVLNPTYPSGFQNHSGLPFQGVAKYTYTLGAGYDYPIGENNLHAEVNWSHRSSAALFENDSLPSTYGGTDFEPLSAVTQKAYGLLDASLSVEIPKYRTTLTIWGKNVLNKRYLVSIIGLVNNGVGTGWGNFGPPATVGVDLKIKF